MTQHGILYGCLYRVEGFVRWSYDEYLTALVPMFPEIPPQEIEPVFDMGNERLFLGS